MDESTGHEVLLAQMVRTPDEPGVLHALTKVILDRNANIACVDIAGRRAA